MLNFSTADHPLIKGKITRLTILPFHEGETPPTINKSLRQKHKKNGGKENPSAVFMKISLEFNNQ